MISDMLLKDLNREETGVANETCDIWPPPCISVPQQTLTRPQGTQATQALKTQGKGLTALNPGWLVLQCYLPLLCTPPLPSLLPLVPGSYLYFLS